MEIDFIETTNPEKKRKKKKKKKKKTLNSKRGKLCIPNRLNAPFLHGFLLGLIKILSHYKRKKKQKEILELGI